MSIVKTGPIKALYLILTFKSNSLSSKLSNISLFNLKSGIPYLNTPPISEFFSNMVTLYPFLAKINAIVIPAGPEPIIATLSFNFNSWLNLVFFKYCDDICVSSSWNLTGSLLIPFIQFPKHWSSWGHIIPQAADNGLLLNKISPASSILPSLKSPIISGIGVSMGQFALHLGFLQRRHLSTSSCNIFKFIFPMTHPPVEYILCNFYTYFSILLLFLIKNYINII